jgi:hypothetical protein
MSNLGRPHWETVKWILRYLTGSTNMKLCFGGSEPNLIAYSIQTWMDISTKESLLRVGAVPCQSMLQTCVALNIIQVKFIVEIEA